ncbi:MAG: hotdog domain-containing protein [Alphaproteobacteria bacterium]
MPSQEAPYFGTEVANACRPTVVPDWTDYNDHFNVAYYAQAFDMAARQFRADCGLAMDVRLRTARSRIDYLQEIPGGAVLTMTTQVLSAGAGGLHLLQALYAGETPYLAAIEERVEVAFDPATGAACSLASVVLERVADVAARHAGLPVPDGWGGLEPESR